jgi:hypothetical protein
MVPVALNTDRMPNDAAGQFFKDVMKSSRWPQGIWIVSPDGKVLAFHYFRPESGESPERGKSRWTREMLAAIDEALKAFGPVTPREAIGGTPFPDRGLGVREDGSVRLAVNSTYLRNGKREGDPVVDSVIVPADEWKQFSPPKEDDGAEWAIPEETARRFALVLSPLTDSLYTPQPKDCKAADFACRIEGVTEGRILIHMIGGWQTEHFRDGDPKLPIRARSVADGYAEYDPVKKQLTSFLLVFHGTYRNVPPWDGVKKTGGVVEWRLKPAKP